MTFGDGADGPQGLPLFLCPLVSELKLRPPRSHLRDRFLVCPPRRSNATRLPRKRFDTDFPLPAKLPLPAPALEGFRLRQDFGGYGGPSLDSCRAFARGGGSAPASPFFVSAHS